ncbi:ABC transporter permease [Sphingomonas sp. H39-1-10]|uniref:ABC transporter permease n=1 Tax=Sphingomonas pollutisoli TaxID=3030829 RepID=UPI0023B9EF82|nr:ABC transporter permease [Sphingomonas pollutisoli]MDF0487749.1 ABC transporter permease [Sphingomonas pollutisoli]
MLTRGQDLRRLLWRTTDGFDSQCHVIGALIIRELHTRYGRDNIGYLWMLAEPMLLAGAVAVIHVGSEGTGNIHGSDLRAVPFALTGYCVFIIFRSIVSRSETALESNKTLLFHRMVTVFDILFSRALLEFLSTVCALAILLSAAVILGLAAPPARPLLFLAAVFLFSWFAFAISMMVSAATHFSHSASKLIHPAIYIFMPLSGAFFLLSWIPEPYRTWVSWSPSVQIFEMVHMGQFGSIEEAQFNPIYIVGWCLLLTVIGLSALRVLRRHVHLS